MYNSKNLPVDLERVERIEATIARLEAHYKVATTADDRDSIGSAIDAWIAMLIEVKHPR